MRNLKLSPKAAKEYKSLARKDKNLLRKTDARMKQLLVADDPGSRLEIGGNPHSLKRDFKDYWGVTSVGGNRIVYKWDDENLYVIKVKGHYEDH